MTRIVGIGGKLASGKDAISDHLVENHGWVKLGMSDALADALYVLNPLIEVPGGRHEFSIIQRYQELFNAVGYVKAKENPEVRRLLQMLGTEVGRNMIGENVWTDIIERRIRALVSQGVPGIIVTGIRFPNEVSVIESNLDGELWWVNRPSLEETVNAGHASENSVGIDDFHIVIENDSTLDALYGKVDRLID
ncbi:deoxynucleoside monophosphate kinase [Microbacterium phage Cece]|nr:deoxynucleoside monophosphate kinase [Microbacterium phage Cece]